jgi:hypothetical protein
VGEKNSKDETKRPSLLRIDSKSNVCNMSKIEILGELPKLTPEERQEVRLRLAELDREDWLDERNAVDCGDSVAYFSFEVKSDLPAQLKEGVSEALGIDTETDLPAQIKESLSEAVEIDAKTRIYIIFRGENHNMKGRFIFGKRKAPPWAGSAPGKETEEDENGG